MKLTNNIFYTSALPSFIQCSVIPKSILSILLILLRSIDLLKSVCFELYEKTLLNLNPC